MACHGKYPILKAKIIPNFIQKKIQFIQHVIYSYKPYKHSLFCFIYKCIRVIMSSEIIFYIRYRQLIQTRKFYP